MKTMIRFLPATLLALVFSVGIANAQSHQHEKQDAQSNDIMTAQVINGVQVIKIEVGKMGFGVDKIALKAGLPARLIFTRTEEGGCTYQVQVPDFGVEATDLPLNEPVAIEFTPKESGTFTFACGMGMVEGTVLVKA